VTNPDVSSAVAALRALLTEDLDTYRRLHAGLDAGQRRAFAVVLTAAFNEAAVRRFGDDSAPASIIGFVADARARYPRTGEAVPAEDAEAVIRAALGEDELIEGLDGHAYGAAQTAMLFALTRDQDVEALLSDAAAQGEDYLQRRANR
jgi:pimeloyl-ACP methyl ester carboxylesterase